MTLIRFIKPGFLVFCFSVLFAPIPVAANVVINEVAWMGTTASANDEWVELYNNSNDEIELTGWTIKSADKSPAINLSGSIMAGGYFLLERTDDNSVVGISADQIYTGALSNGGEYLQLYNSTGALVDEINSGRGWFAGDNASKQTMERKNPNSTGSSSASWQTSQSPGGTPKTKNSGGAIVNETQTKIPTDKSANLLIATDGIFTVGIVINELLPAPNTSQGQDEWIEIFNQNDFNVDMSGWILQDTAGKITSYKIPVKTIISAGGFLLLPKTQTKITLNNDADGLILSAGEETADKVEYLSAPKGKSFNRVIEDWVWSTKLTPGDANEAEAKKNETQGINTVPNPNKKELAAVGAQLLNGTSPVLTVIIALITAFLSTVMVFLLKKSYPGEKKGGENFIKNN